MFNLRVFVVLLFSVLVLDSQLGVGQEWKLEHASADHSTRIRDIAVHEKAGLIATCSASNVVVTKIEDKTNCIKLPVSFNRVQFSSSGRFVIGLDRTFHSSDSREKFFVSTIVSIDSRSGKLHSLLPPQVARVSSFAMSPDEKLIAFGCQGSVSVFNIEKNKLVSQQEIKPSLLPKPENLSSLIGSAEPTPISMFFNSDSNRLAT